MRIVKFCESAAPAANPNPAGRGGGGQQISEFFEGASPRGLKKEKGKHRYTASLATLSDGSEYEHRHVL